jgi:hypothetical protein
MERFHEVEDGLEEAGLQGEAGGRAMKTAGHWKRVLYTLANVLGAVVIVLLLLDPTRLLLRVCVLLGASAW